jgi:Tfp pilus assembly protein PilE
MKNLKTQKLFKGFMLMEAVIAVAIMAILLTPLLLLNYNLFNRVIVNKEKIEHFLPLEVALLTTHTQPLEQDQTEQRTQIQGPSMDILYQVSPASGQLERFKDLYIQTVTGRWQATTEKEFVINQLLYRPQSQTKKES